MGDRERLVGAWTDAFERECVPLIEAVLTRAPHERARAWRQLMANVAPYIERWAEQSFLLRRCGLATPDDARTVLVSVLARMQANDFANLRRFRDRQDPGDASDRADTRTLSCILKLTELDEPATAHVAMPARDSSTATPLRAWLITLVGYTAKDHVRDRLGWAQPPAEASGEREAGGTKRDVNTNATRLDDSDEPGARPPMTNLLTMQRFLCEVLTFVDTFPPDMRTATRLWLQDLSCDEIAEQLEGASVASATALVRAAKARLRERFRSDWDQLRGFGV